MPATRPSPGAYRAVATALVLILGGCSGSGTTSSARPGLDRPTGPSTVAESPTNPPATPLTTTTVPSQPSCASNQQLVDEVPRVAFIFQDGVVDSDRAQIIRGVQLAQQFLGTNLAYVQGFACFDVNIDATRNGSGSENGIHVVMYTDVTGWKAPQGESSWHLTKVAAHEYFHVWQHEFPGYITVPNWLSEGAAEFAGYRSAIDGNVVSERHTRDFSIRNVQFGGSVVPLQSSEPRPPTAPQVNYGYVELAVTYLIKDKGIAALRSFWSGLAGGWQGAFQTAFGLAVSDFYAQFADYQARGFQ